ncbi:alpha/beta-hydrolase [Gloeopeniophorella convolvens]|nr:alpha/beta-hydrolase [Gloeopeniophorella convolvens]
MFFSLGFILTLGAYAAAAPSRFVSRTGVTTLSSTDISAFAPFTQFARAAYCPSSKIQGWQCGQACDALPGFQPTLTGGDGSGTQLFFVGFWPTESAVVVAHQGTNPTKLKADLTDLNVDKGKLDNTLFPGVPSGVEVHGGFSDEHKKTATQILTEVKKLMAQHSATKVILVGHSLGGALAEIECMFMKLNLPAGTSIKGVTYGTPRVGNAAWANFFDSQVPDFTRVNNKHDLVPIVPGRFLGFVHPSGEVHVNEDGTAVQCPGQDDSKDSQCSDSTVPTILSGKVADHLGPYPGGISIGSAACI